MELMGLTGYESGVVIWTDSEEGLAINWSVLDGLPRLFAGTFIGLKDGDDLAPSVLANWEEEFAKELATSEGDDNPEIDGIWRNAEAVVVTFSGWN